MTYEEALKILEPIVFESDREALALMEAKEALEKQIAKKPINKTGLDNTIAFRYENCNIVVCPNCRGRLKLKSKGKYCDKCGKALDWSE